MTKKELEQVKKEAWEAGENDTVAQDVLIENAQLFADEQGYDNDKEFDAIIDAYEDGFLGRPLKEVKKKKVNGKKI
jgi:hypothetical protein